MGVKGFLLGAAAGAAGACGAMFARSRWGRREIRGYLDLVQLTMSQRCRVEEIREKFLPRVAALRQRLREQRLRLAELLFAPAPDREKIAEAVEQIVRLRRELEEEVVGHIIEEATLLSADQQRAYHKVIIEQFSGGGLGVHDVRGSGCDVQGSAWV